MYVPEGWNRAVGSKVYWGEYEIEEFVKFNIDSYPEYTRKSNV